MTNKENIVKLALMAPACERLRDWASIGPVQRAALEEYTLALIEELIKLKESR